MTTKNTATKATTVVEPNPVAEIGVTGTLRRGVHAHRITGTEPAANDQQQWGGQAVTACTRKPVRSYSYAFAKTQGVILCRTCFGGPQ